MRQPVRPRRAAAGSALALVAGIAACAGETPAPSPGSPAAVAAARSDTATLYGDRCGGCHREDGRGLAGSFPPLAGSEWVTGDPAVAIRAVLNHTHGPITVAGQRYEGGMMAFGTGRPMTDHEVAMVVSYARTTWGNAAAPVAPADVASERAAGGGRPRVMTADELRGDR